MGVLVTDVALSLSAPFRSRWYTPKVRPNYAAIWLGGAAAGESQPLRVLIVFWHAQTHAGQR